MNRETYCHVKVISLSTFTCEGHFRNNLRNLMVSYWLILNKGFVYRWKDLFKCFSMEYIKRISKSAMHDIAC